MKLKILLAFPFNGSLYTSLQVTGSLGVCVKKHLDTLSTGYFKGYTLLRFFIMLASKIEFCFLCRK